MTRLTIEQIAALAGVSRSTVSRVLNNHPSVRPAVRDHIVQVIDTHGYAPRAAARSLANSRTNVIAFLIPRSTAVIFTDPFFSLVVQGIAEVCAQRGYLLMLAMVTGDMERDFVRVLRSHYFDGVVMHAADIDDPVLPRLIADGTPLVQIGRHPYVEHLSWVNVENRAGARAATAHLLGARHRRIATITGPLREAAALDRRDGYKQALLDAHLSIDPALIVEGDWSQESGYAAAARLLALPQRPSAIFAANDLMAIGALHALHEAGLSVPRDLALVGFDDTPVAAFASPPLTTVRQPIHEMGVAATTLLIERLEHPDREPVHISLPTTLVVRESCGSTAQTSPPHDSAAPQRDGVGAATIRPVDCAEPLAAPASAQHARQAARPDLVRSGHHAPGRAPKGGETARRRARRG